MEFGVNEKFLKIAIDLSINNVVKGNGGPFGAIIVKDNKIISKATNSVTSDFDPSAHSEINAIRKACKKLKTHDLSGCTIYTSCEPCPMCLGAIYWANIREVYYSCSRSDTALIDFEDAFMYLSIYREMIKDQSFQKIKKIQLLRQEALVAFNLWEKSENKIKY